MILLYDLIKVIENIVLKERVLYHINAYKQKSSHTLMHGLG